MGAPWGVGVSGAIRGHWEEDMGCRGVRDVLGMAGSVGTQDQKGYRWHKGAFGAPGSVGASRGH